MLQWYLRSAIALALLSGCFGTHGTRGDAGSSDASYRAPDGGTSAGDGGDCPGLGGYRTCGSHCEARCPRSDGCLQYFDICVPFDDSTGCSLTLSSTEDDYPDRSYCVDGQVCVVADEVLEAEGAIWGACVREAYCRELSSAGIEGRCWWSDETEFVDGAPHVESCPDTTHPFVTFCGGPCGGCERDFWVIRYSSNASCTGVSERRGFGVCTFNGRSPCSEGDPGVAAGCAQSSDWGEDCACLLLQLPDGTFNDVGYPTLASSCREYQEQFPDTVRCMDPFEWVTLEP